MSNWEEYKAREECRERVIRLITCIVLKGGRKGLRSLCFRGLSRTIRKVLVRCRKTRR